MTALGDQSRNKTLTKCGTALTIFGTIAFGRQRPERVFPNFFHANPSIFPETAKLEFGFPNWRAQHSKDRPFPVSRE
jgi:hypothetical protein